MRDRIFVDGLELEGRIGVFEGEKRTPQRYLVGIEVELDLREAGQADDLEKSVDYVVLIELAERVMREKAGANLIETYAEKMCSELLGTFGNIQKVKISVEKPDVEIDGRRFSSLRGEQLRASGP